MEDAKSQNSKPHKLPYYRINKNAVEKLMFNLHDYITPVYPSDMEKKSFIRPFINVADYFNQRERPRVATYDDNNRQIISYDLTTQ